jgi:hypothetical protein
LVLTVAVQLGAKLHVSLSGWNCPQVKVIEEIVCASAVKNALIMDD